MPRGAERQQPALGGRVALTAVGLAEVLDLGEQLVGGAVVLLDAARSLLPPGPQLQHALHATEGIRPGRAGAPTTVAPAGTSSTTTAFATSSRPADPHRADHLGSGADAHAAFDRGALHVARAQPDRTTGRSPRPSGSRPGRRSRPGRGSGRTPGWTSTESPIRFAAAIASRCAMRGTNRTPRAGKLALRR